MYNCIHNIFIYTYINTLLLDKEGRNALRRNVHMHDVPNVGTSMHQHYGPQTTSSVRKPVYVLHAGIHAKLAN
jgi:hypothetical protein